MFANNRLKILSDKVDEWNWEKHDSVFEQVDCQTIFAEENQDVTRNFLIKSLKSLKKIFPAIQSFWLWQSSSMIFTTRV